MHPQALSSSGKITDIQILTTIIIFLITLSLSSALASPVIALSKDTKPDDPWFVAPHITFVCNALDTLELSPGLIDTLRNDTTDGPTELPGYNCAPWSEEGPEHVYRLDVLSELELWAGLRDIAEEDLDLFLLNDCDTDSCLVGANTEFSIQLQPGTYYLIVDGAGTSSPAAGPYAVAWETRYLDLPPATCDESIDTEVFYGGNVIPIEGNLFGQTNYVQTYDCSPIIERGGEAWYAITLQQYHNFTVTTTVLAPDLDAALWLFDTCGPTASCLAFADEAISGQPESLSWTNNSEEAITVYLALDSHRMVTNEDTGIFGLEITGLQNVPTSKKSWGSLRARYRTPKP